MAKLDEQRSASRTKAEELLNRRKKQETERLTNRERDSRVMDEKIARLRELRLAKEVADKEAAKRTNFAPRRRALKSA